MGLGKTVEVLACVLAHKRQPNGPSAGSGLEDEDDRAQSVEHADSARDDEEQSAPQSTSGEFDTFLVAVIKMRKMAALLLLFRSVTCFSRDIDDEVGHDVAVGTCSTY